MRILPDFVPYQELSDKAMGCHNHIQIYLAMVEVYKQGFSIGFERGSNQPRYQAAHPTILPGQTNL